MKYLSTNPQSMEKWSFRDDEVLFHMTRQKKPYNKDKI
jgi:hypothetical protein